MADQSFDTCRVIENLKRYAAEREAKGLKVSDPIKNYIKTGKLYSEEMECEFPVDSALSAHFVGADSFRRADVRDVIVNSEQGLDAYV